MTPEELHTATMFATAVSKMKQAHAQNLPLTLNVDETHGLYWGIDMMREREAK